MIKDFFDFDKDRCHVRLLVWAIEDTEHCALIKTIETLVEKQNKSHHKYYYCMRRTHWFSLFVKDINHDCSQLFKPKIVRPNKKKIYYLNELEQQEIKNIITDDIECFVVDVRSHIV